MKTENNIKIDSRKCNYTVTFSGKTTLNFFINLILYFFINFILTFTLENLKVNVKLLLGLKKETMEEMEKRHEKQKARLYLAFLIEDLLFEKNPYEEKQLIKNSQILTRWFEYYKININFVTKDEIDTLFIIMKKI